MKKVLAAIQLVLLVIFMLFLHLGAAYFLPYPWNTLNTIFMILVILMMTKETGQTVWLAFITHFFIELYATTPFGIILCSSTLSFLFTYWLSQSIFINKSWYTAFAFSAVSLIFYRIIYILLLIITGVFLETAPISWSLMFRYFGWELILTSIVAGVASLLIAPREKKRGTFFLH